MNRRIAHLLLCLFAAIFWFTAVPGRCDAGFINYTATIVVGEAFGPDTDGLSNATITLAVRFSTDSTYIESFFGGPVALTSSAQVTISGSSIAANNGRFTVGQHAFYPAFGFNNSIEPYAPDFIPKLTLNSGGNLYLFVGTIETPSGTMVSVGDRVALEHFFPFPGRGFFVSVSTDDTFYDLRPGSSLRITETASTPVAPTALAGLIGVAGLVVVRRRKAA